MSRKRPVWLPPPPRRPPPVKPPVKPPLGKSGAGAKTTAKPAAAAKPAPPAKPPAQAKAAAGRTPAPPRGVASRPEPVPGSPQWLYLVEEPLIVAPGADESPAARARARPAAAAKPAVPAAPPVAATAAAPRGQPPTAPAAAPAASGALSAEVLRLSSTELRSLAIKTHKADKAAESIPLYEHYLAREPADHQIWSNLGTALRAAGHYAAAVAMQRRAIAMAPREGAYWSNLGNALKDADRLDEAVDAHKQAVALKPSEAPWYHNLAVTLREAGRHQESLETFERAIRLQPRQDSYRWDRAVVLLHLGRWEEGWVGYEWRYRIGELTPRRRDIPRWVGEPIPGKRLLLHPEQGFGDTLFALRFLPEIKARVGRTLVVTRPPLMRLFEGVEGIDEIVPVEKRAETPCDYHASLMDLPGICKARPDSAPMPPKLNIPKDARAKAAAILAPAGNRFTVGVVWSGSVTFKNNRRRAVDAERFLTLAEVPGVQLVSLQKGPRETELDEPGILPLFIDAGRKVQDFAETAALIEALDLVIMTDSSVAHLCGTLGRPVWNLLNSVPYWLYGDVGERTGWYPSMRFFRQPMTGAWDSVFAMVKSELARAVELKKAGKWPPPLLSLVAQPRDLTAMPFSSPIAKLS